MSGTRMGGDAPKAYQTIAGRPLLVWALETMAQHPAIGPVVVVHDPDHQAWLQPILQTHRNVIATSGGATRAHSVHQGLKALAPHAPDVVLVHDVARAFMPAVVIEDLLRAVRPGQGAVPSLPVVDTLRHVEGEVIAGDIDRNHCRIIQTPQAFLFDELLAAHDQAADLSAFTDDASVARAAGLRVLAVPGHAHGFKLTYAADRERAEQMLAMASPVPKVGSGFDVHRFGPGDHLWLCGVRLPHSHGLVGHSDADVGLHALTDAILGTIGAGDIGQHFPPTDPKWKGAASDQFVAHACDLLRQAGGRLMNIDLTIIGQRPKIFPHRQAMQARIAQITALPASAINIKATTTEGLGFTGRSEGLAAQCVVQALLPV